MAVFEKKVQRRNQLDDTDVLTCTVESSQNIQGHTEYIIRVQRGPSPEKCWRVSKRYRDFATLNGTLSACGVILSLPPKRLIGNMDPLFVAERQVGLQHYLSNLLQHPFLAASISVKQFLDPTNYSVPLQESALHSVSLALRGEAEWEVLRPVPELGWRIRKHYFFVRRHLANKSDQELLLSWVEHGPDMCVEISQLQAALSAVTAVQAPIGVNVELVRCNEAGCLVVRPLLEKGSLRDTLYGSKLCSPFLRKYACPKQAFVFSGKELVSYCRQILHILAIFHQKGVPYGQLHSGNVCIDNGRILLLDVEGGLLGLPSLLRPFIIQHRRLDTLPRVDIYCFGHLLYEMAFGRSLQASSVEKESLPSSCPPLLADVLEQVLSPRALREALPTAQQLLQHEFFRVIVEDEPPNRQMLKLPASAREVVRLISLKIEERLRHDQKIVHHQRRLARVHEMMSSEEEKKRRKQKWKQRERERQQQQNNLANGKSPERSDSPASTSTATSAGTVTPPPGIGDAGFTAAPPPPPPAPAAPPLTGGLPSLTTSVSTERSALLSSICAFKKSSLRHTGTPG